MKMGIYISVAIVIITAISVHRKGITGKSEKPVSSKEEIYRKIAEYLACCAVIFGVGIIFDLVLQAMLMCAFIIQVGITDIEMFKLKKQYECDKRGLRKIAKRRAKVGNVTLLSLLVILALYMGLLRCDCSYLAKVEVQYRVYQADKSPTVKLDMMDKAFICVGTESKILEMLAPKCRVYRDICEVAVIDEVNLIEGTYVADSDFILEESGLRDKAVTAFVELHNAVYSGKMNRADAVREYDSVIAGLVSGYYCTIAVGLILFLMFIQCGASLIEVGSYKMLYEQLSLELRKGKLSKKIKKANAACEKGVEE